MDYEVFLVCWARWSSGTASLDSAHVTGSSCRRWRSGPATSSAPMSWPMRCGGTPAGVGARSAGLRGSAAQGAGASRSDVAARLRLVVPAEAVDAPVFERTVARVGAADGSARPSGRRTSPGRAGPVARASRRRPGGLGARQPDAGRLSELRLEAEELRARRAAAGRAVTARSSPRRRSWSAPRRCVSTAGCCWPARSTSPGRRARRCARLHQLKAPAGRAPGHRPGPRLGRAGGVDPAPGHLDCWSLSPRPPVGDLSVAGPDGRTASRTPTGSSGGTTTWPPAWSILARTSVLALVGPSGAGKSSLLRAGVAAALRRAGSPV